MADKLLEAYFKNASKIMSEAKAEAIEQVIDVILKAHKKDRQVFVFGNGGSAVAASHFACDLGKEIPSKGRRFRVMSLNDNVAHFSAIANDLGYENTFVEQLKNLMNLGDVVIGISVSGNSENLLRAFAFARKRGATTIGWIGSKGGRLLKLCSAAVVVSSRDFGLVEGFHSILGHFIAYSIHKRLGRQ